MNEETSEVSKKYFVGCYTQWLKDGIYAVINVSVEIFKYFQMFIIVRAAIFLEGIQAIQFYHKKKNKQINTGILMKLTKNLAKNSLWARN